MIGILVELLISWALLHFIEKKSLNAIGVLPDGKQWTQSGLGFSAAFGYYVILINIMALAVDNPYVRNLFYTGPTFLNALGYTIRSVAFETLIFHGALLYILWKRIGANWSVILSAIAFGTYHWFSWNLFGQWNNMAFVFISTGLIGWVLAYSFVRTSSVWVPFAIHFGLNFTTGIIFSKDSSLGRQFLLPRFSDDPVAPSTIVSIALGFLYYVGFPVFMFLMFKTREKRNP